MSKNDRQHALVPRMRFPEFRNTTAWVDKPLGEFGRFFRGLTYSASDVADEGLLVLRSSNIQNGSLVLGSDLVFVDKDCPPDLLLRTGDIAICMSNGSKPLVGKNAEFKGDFDNPLTIGAFCSAFRPSNEFAKHLLQTPRYHHFVADTIGGGNINNLKNSDLETLNFSVPLEDAEQQKIADCLGSLDDLIAAEGRKLAALRNHKKGLMQQLFPREGETRPRLRFPEFRDAGEWKESTVGSKCQSFSGGTPDTTRKDFYGGTIPFIRSAEIGSETTTQFLTEEGYEGSAAKMVTRGDVLVALYGANSGDVALARLDGAINQAILCLRPEGSKAFLYHYLTQRKDWILAKYLQGGQGNLSGEIVKSVSLRFPSPEEQETIADCLASLDAMISSHAKMLDALRTHKRGLMQELFPMVEGVA